jgi:hypothetical protein
VSLSSRLMITVSRAPSIYVARCEYYPMNMSRLLLLLSSIPFALSIIGNATTPRALQWSEKNYDPDGLWHAITVLIGTSEQSVDLFPGGFLYSNTLSTSLYTDLSQECYSSTATTILCKLPQMYQPNYPRQGVVGMSVTAHLQAMVPLP